MSPMLDLDRYIINVSAWSLRYRKPIRRLSRDKVVAMIVAMNDKAIRRVQSMSDAESGDLVERFESLMTGVQSRIADTDPQPC